VERLSTDFAGTFELALWCKLLRDRGWTGNQVALSLGRSEGYVNNLIRILERASLEVLARWKAEQARGNGQAPPVIPICATDWLMHVCVLPHDQQNLELAKRIEKFQGPRQALRVEQENEKREPGS
jgi:hypothetical protein